MSETNATTPLEATARGPRALKILAKSVYKELRTTGYSRSEVVGFTNELLELIATDLKTEDDASS